MAAEPRLVLSTRKPQVETPDATEYLSSWAAYFETYQYERLSFTTFIPSLDSVDRIASSLKLSQVKQLQTFKSHFISHSSSFLCLRVETATAGLLHTLKISKSLYSSAQLDATH